MEKYGGQFEQEYEEFLKKCIKEPWFINLSDLVNICDMNGDEENILQNIKDYIWIFLAKRREEEFASATKKFLNFLEAYNSKKEPCFKGRGEGELFDTTQDLLQISNGYHINGSFNRNRNNVFL